jgi:DNA-binding transcriptional LysR family regulator
MAHTALNSLHAFLTVAQRHSFSKAARDLGVSPSAVSQAVRQLEQRVGQPLLRRTTRSVAPTAAGRRLFERAAPAIGDALAALASVGREPDEVRGSIRLTVPSIALPFLLEPILTPFALRHPEVEVNLIVENEKRDVVADGFDGGVRLGEFLERDMVALPISAPSRWVVAASPRYLGRRGTPVHPRDLAAHDCIGYQSPNTGGVYAWELERGKKTWKLPVRGPISANDERVQLAMAVAGVGLVYAMETLVAPLVAKRRLRLVLEDYAATGPGFYLYYPSRTQASLAFRALLEQVRVTSGPFRSVTERNRRAI